MYARRGGLGALTTEGAAVGTVIAGPLGTVAGGLLGGLFGGKSYPTQSLTVNTPSGPLQITFSGAGPVQGSAQYIFTQWAQAGRFADLASIANTGTGPKWDNPSVTYSGYGQVDRNFAAELVQAYQRATDNVTGAPLVPAGTSVVAYQAAQPVRAPGTPAPAAAGFSPLLGLGIGAAAIAAVLMATGGKRRNNPRHRHRLPAYTSYSANRRHRRRSHRRRSGRRRR